MNLREEILKEHSSRNTLQLAGFVIKKQHRFAELMDLFLHDEYRVVQRSSWVVRHVAESRPEWIIPYLGKMLRYCRQPVHDAVKRNVMCLLQDITIPHHLHGLAVTVCFELLQSPVEPVAVKVFSMTVLSNLVISEPDLKNELILVIEDQLEFSKPAFRSRALKILKSLRN